MANELVTVGNFLFVPEAEAARLHLQEEGIRAFLSNAELVNMEWMLGNATGYVKILVPADQAIAARGILEVLQAQKQARRRDRFTTGETSVCLACGEKLPADQSTCAACGWSYEADADENEVNEPSGFDEPARPAGDSPATPEKDATEADDSEKGPRANDKRENDKREIGDRDNDNPAETDEDAQELAETSATNVRLLIGLVVGGAFVLWLLPQLRAIVRSWL